MPKMKRFITNLQTQQIAATAAGNAIYKQRMNTKAIWNVFAAATLLELVYANGLPGDTGADYPTSLQVQSAVRLYTGATGQGAGFTTGGTLNIPKGTRAFSSVISLTTVREQTIQICTFSDAGSGKKTPNTSFNRPTGDGWAIEFGDALTPNLDGSLTGGDGARTGNHPMALIGQTGTKAIAGVGHSVMAGTGDTYFLGWLQRLSALVRVAAFQGGTVGSSPGDLSSGWSNSDRSMLTRGNLVYLQWGVNAINNAFLAGQSPSSFVTDFTATIRRVINDLNTLGLDVILCTEGLTGASGSQEAGRTAILAAWNVSVRTNWAAWGCKGLLDIAGVIMTSTDSNVMKPELLQSGEDGIHPGPLATQAIAVEAANLLSRSTLLGEDSAKFTEAFTDDFYGGLTTAGDDFGIWTQWRSTFATLRQFYRTADGRLGIAPEHGLPVYLLARAATYSQGMVEAAGTWKAQTGASEGYGVGFVLDAEGSAGRKRGYIAFATTNGNFYIQSMDSTNTLRNEDTVAITGGAPTDGAMWRITVEKIDSLTGAGSDIVAKFYCGSQTPKATITLVNNDRAGLGRTAMYPAITYVGDSVNSPVAQADVLDYFRFYTYTPYTISGVTIGQGSALSVAGGSTTNLTATVAGSGSFPATYSWRIVSGAGSIGLYSGAFVAPAQTGSAQTTVVEVAAAGREATATISITVPGSGSAITGITINQGDAATVNGGATLALTATVTGTGSFSTAVTWSIVSGAGTVNSSSGLFQAPAATGSAQLTVVRATAADGTTADEINITTPASGTITGVTITNGDTATVQGDATLALAATVQGTGGFSTVVTWSIVSGQGTVNSSTGLFQAPGAGLTDKTTIVRALAADGVTADSITILTPKASTGGGGGGALEPQQPDASFSGILGATTIPAAGANYLPFYLYVTAGGDPVTASVYPVRIAFVASLSDTPSWVSTEVVAGRHSLRRVLVGVGGVALSAGEYFVRLECTSGVEISYLNIGKVTVI